MIYMPLTHIPNQVKAVYERAGETYRSTTGRGWYPNNSECVTLFSSAFKRKVILDQQLMEFMMVFEDHEESEILIWKLNE